MENSTLRQIFEDSFSSIYLRISAGNSGNLEFEKSLFNFHFPNTFVTNKENTTLQSSETYINFFRTQLIENQQTSDDIRILELLEISDPVLSAERLNLLAIAHYKDPIIATKLFLQAYSMFQRLNLPRRALYSLLLSHGCQLDNGIPISMPHFQLIYEAAKSDSHYFIMGLCRMYQARNFALSRQFKQACSYAQRAAHLLLKEGTSTEYYACLLDLAYYSIKCQKYDSFKKPLNITESSTSKTVQLIRSNLNGHRQGYIEPRLNFLIWNSRFSDTGLTPKRLTPLEGNFIELLVQGPMRKTDIVKNIYGNDADYYLLDLRIKNLISRIRRKTTGLIDYKAGKYCLKNLEYARALLNYTEEDQPMNL